jgi:hypothetical protein
MVLLVISAVVGFIVLEGNKKKLLVVGISAGLLAIGPIVRALNKPDASWYESLERTEVVTDYCVTYGIKRAAPYAPLPDPASESASKEIRGQIRQLFAESTCSLKEDWGDMCRVFSPLILLAETHPESVSPALLTDLLSEKRRIQVWTNNGCF